MSTRIKLSYLIIASVLAFGGGFVFAENSHKAFQAANIVSSLATFPQQGRVDSAEPMYCAGFLLNKINTPESGAFLLFISGVVSMIGIGWVRKRKS